MYYNCRQFLGSFFLYLVIHGVYTMYNELLTHLSLMFVEKYGNNYYGYCQAGISAVYADKYNLVMGAVGASRWKGKYHYNYCHSIIVYCVINKISEFHNHVQNLIAWHQSEA